MLIAKRHRLTAVGLFVLVVLTLEWKAESHRPADKRLRRNVAKPAEPELVSAVAGKPKKIVYKASNDVLAMNAEKFGQWTKNKNRVVQTDYFVIGGKREKKRFWLKIKSVHTRDKGLYSFRINDTVVGQWQLRVKEMSESCGGPVEEPASACVKFSKISYPNCRSFPGPPLNVNVSSHLFKRKPIVQVVWNPPNNGFSDLWGYQVYIAGKDNHAGHFDCHQINSKNERLYWIFKDYIKYGATYQITVQSMPANYQSDDKNEVVKNVKVPEKCLFQEYTNSAQCCSIINITAEYSEKAIHLKWMVPLQNQCKEIKAFMIEWNNIQKPEECNGQKLIEDKYEYLIPLEKDECTKFNYSIKLRGKTNKTETKTFRVTVLIPPPILPTPKPPDNSKKIMMAAFGAVLGFLIFGLLVMYRIFFRQVVIDLPDPPSPRPPSDHPLLASDKTRVFIMHTRCCDKCSFVVHCFGEVLNSTELIEASIDMWSTLDIAPNVPRWYEDQVKHSHCVIVLASNKMSLRCQNAVEEGDDPLNIKCQLNLVRGQIAQNPDVHRFIPAFFTCSGNKKNIPEFLSSRWSHRLPKEVDRIIFHLLNVEKIQPYRTQPIIVMGGNGHPFDEKKKELERAVLEAELYHKKNNNAQNA
ncbi:uncharacterized protein LOC110062098 [Orbicella faveolata]|uniref:uncharacterized protein LOC110062098 n=1 Tax=Orbicella faveolata TaxID=48498 RepID=UPI0009E3BA3E|nr:uncharacterized protein LOC110062098 [Orbicella faveolata]